MFGEEKAPEKPHTKVVIETTEGDEYEYEHEDGGSEVAVAKGDDWVTVRKADGQLVSFPTLNVRRVEEWLE